MAHLSFEVSHTHTHVYMHTYMHTYIQTLPWVGAKSSAFSMQTSANQLDQWYAKTASPFLSTCGSCHHRPPCSGTLRPIICTRVYVCGPHHCRPSWIGTLRPVHVCMCVWLATTGLCIYLYIHVRICIMSYTTLHLWSTSIYMYVYESYHTRSCTCPYISSRLVCYTWIYTQHAYVNNTLSFQVSGIPESRE